MVRISLLTGHGNPATQPVPTLDHAATALIGNPAMATKYISPHHSPDDPGGVIKEILLMGPEFLGPAEDVMIAWTLRLGADQDPAGAAERLLTAYGVAEGPLPEGACGKLVDLLRQAARSHEIPLGKPKRHGRRHRD